MIDRDRPQRSAGRGNLLLHEHREVLLVVEAGRGVERLLAAGACLVQARTELFFGRSAARLLLEHRVDRRELAAHRADLVLGLLRAGLRSARASAPSATPAIAATTPAEPGNDRETWAN